MRLIFVRHGETVGKSSIRFFGKTDVALNYEGREQMKAVRDRLRNEVFGGVFSSPLSRCIEGASIILGDRNQPIRQIEEFTEINFGRWEGLTLDEIEGKDPDLFFEWRKKLWNFDYPQGDKREDFVKRVELGMDKVIDMAGEGSFLLVLHKGIIRTIFYYLLGVDDSSFKFDADLGSIHELEKVNGKWCLKKLNYTEHL